MKKIAVVLNGCGHRDGSEIHEAVLTLLAIEEAGASWECLAVNADQAKVLNHMDGSEEKNTPPRNMLRESARIARGRVKDLAHAQVADYKGVMIPGGSGTALNLCDFAAKGAEMAVNPTLAGFLESAHAAGKPIGAVCISPVILAKVFGKLSPRVTLGDAECDAAKAARDMGAEMISCAADGCVVDTKNRLVTTPAYMLDASMAQIAKGIGKAVENLVRMAD